MKTENTIKQVPRILKVVLVIALSAFVSSCSKSGDDPVGDGVYSGSGNFTFTGDYNESFSGTISNASIQRSNGIELLPLEFRNSQGQELFIGLKSTVLEVRTYTIKEFDDEGYAGMTFPNGLYDTGAIGGKGTVNLTSVNGREIKGTVDMRLARPLNTADTVIVKGNFALKSQ